MEVCLCWEGPDLLCGDSFCVIVESWMGHKWVNGKKRKESRFVQGCTWIRINRKCVKTDLEMMAGL